MRAATIFCLLPLLMLAVCQRGLGWSPLPQVDDQSIDLPVKSIEEVSFIDADISFEDQCFEAMIIDPVGRLWFENCYHMQITYETFIKVYDGNALHEVELSPEIARMASGEAIDFIGINEDGIIIAKLGSWVGGISVLIGIDTQTGETSFLTDTSKQAKAYLARDELEIAVVQDGEDIYVQKLGVANQLLGKINIPEENNPIDDQLNGYFQVIGLHDNHILFTLGHDQIHNFDLESGETNRVKVNGIGNNKFHVKEYSRLIHDPSGPVIFIPKSPVLYYGYDEEDQSVKPIDFAPKVEGYRIHQFFPDNAGQLVAQYIEDGKPFGSEKHLQLFRDHDGEWSRLILPQADSLTVYKAIVFIETKSYNESFILYHERRLKVSKISRQDITMQTWSDSKANREILEIEPGRFMKFSVEGISIITSGTNEISKLSDECVEGGLQKNSLTDLNGNLYVHQNRQVLLFDLETQQCHEIASIPHPISRIDFLNDKELLLITKGGFYRVDIFSGETKSLTPESEDVYIDEHMQHHLLKDGILWIGARGGLYKLILETHEFKKYGLNYLPDQRVLHIDPHPDGTLWLSTFAKGVVVFDPVTEKVVHEISRVNGLSNNSVVASLRDEFGYVWAATYRGLNLINPEREVIGSFFENDGLTHHEFNRNSACRAMNGDLLFGTVEGINLIRPSLVIDKITAGKVPQLYLAASEYTSVGTRQSEQKQEFGEPELIELPAHARNLNLYYGQSSLFQIKDNRYSYRLTNRGGSKEWTDLGSLTSLRLTNLPSGRYNVEIKGRDFRGNTSEVLIVPIKVRQFFYKQPWFLASLVLLLSGAAIGWISYLRSAKKRLEKVVAFRTRQIESDKELIQLQAEELIQLDKAKSDFFTNISHELRTPITLIDGPLKLIREELGNDSPIANRLSPVLANSQKLKNLVEELLELSRIDANKATLNESSTNLSLFINKICEAYNGMAEYKKINFSYEKQLELDGPVKLDQKRFRKIIDNLLSNAFKFTSPGDSITVLLKGTNEQAFVSVQDTGKGIPAADLPSLFDRYFQAGQEDDAQSKGSGIGLAMAKEFAHLLRGELEVESKIEQGSTFTLSIPLTRSYDEATQTKFDLAPDMMSEEEREISPTDTSNGTANILVVEDNKDMQNFICQILEEKFSCFKARDGQQALEILSREPVDKYKLVLSDLSMPRMNGQELLHRLKENSKLSGIPFIMLTASTGSDKRLKALRVGVDDYLEKPFEPEELLIRVQNQVNNYQQRQLALVEIMSEENRVNVNESIQGSTKQNTEAIALTADDQKWLATIEEIVESTIDGGRDIGVAQLADKVFLSERQLRRKLIATTGLSPVKYILEMRLHKARTLLESRKYKTIADVAYAVGFGSADYFSRKFTNRYGRSPASYLN